MPLAPNRDRHTMRHALTAVEITPTELEDAIADLETDGFAELLDAQGNIVRLYVTGDDRDD